MATFIEIVPDGFNATLGKMSKEARLDQTQERFGATSGRFDHVRRPVRGIEIKEDTYATIQVIKSNGENIPLIDAAGIVSDGGATNEIKGKTDRYSNFLIQAMSEQRSEKQQVVVTFGEPYVFFFGEQPRTLDVQGVLLNTVDFNWKAEFLENYERYLRGTRCVQSKARVYLAWDDIIAEGYIMNCAVQEAAAERNWVNFSFQLFLTNYQNISAIGDPVGHLIGKDINLDPGELDTIDSATKGFSSRTVEVRKANIAAQANKKSLLGMLRDGEVLSAFASGTSKLVAIQGQIEDIFERTANYLHGKVVVLPTGYTGAAAFDSETQISLASLDPLLTGVAGNNIITATIGGKNFTINASIGKRWNIPSGKLYGPLSSNTDEFIGRGPTKPEASSEALKNLFKDQRGNEHVAEGVVRATLKAFGIETEAPSEISTLIGKVSFGIVNYVGGNALRGASPSTSHNINIASQLI